MRNNYKMKEPYIKTLNGLIPRYESIRYDSLKPGDEVFCEVTKVRNPRFHRKFFALLNLVFDNQEVFVNIDHMREELTKAAGYYEMYVNHKGITCYKAESISFSSMDDAEFNKFYEAFMKVCCDTWGFDPEKLTNEIK